MRFGAFEFRPGWVPTGVTAVLLALLSGLGVWQLERAEVKRSLLDQWQKRRTADPVPLAQALDGGAPRFTPVAAKGRFDGKHQYLLDNRIRNNRPGFHVLTPLKLAGSEAAILVNRGWVAMGEGRSDLPELPVPEGTVRITGSLAPPPQTGIRLGAPDAGQASWPRVVQYMVPERMTEQLGYPVKAQVVRLDAKAPGGFERDWGAPVPFGPERHLGYAVHWFGLAIALLVIYLVVNFKRRTPAHGGNPIDR